jgi:hypothetical protein
VRVYCDFHKAVDARTFLLTTIGSSGDLDRLGPAVTVGVPLTFWMDDGDADGRRDDLLVDGVLDRLADGTWIARVDPATWRHDSDERSRIPPNKA